MPEWYNDTDIIFTGKGMRQSKRDKIAKFLGTLSKDEVDIIVTLQSDYHAWALAEQSNSPIIYEIDHS